jgi:hypothetical protein
MLKRFKNKEFVSLSKMIVSISADFRKTQARMRRIVWQITTGKVLLIG